MYKKHLEHFLTVSLKYLFDFDYTYFHNAYLSLLLVPFMIKLLMLGLAAYLYEGIITVKNDFVEIKTNAATYRQLWLESGLRTTIVDNIRAARANIMESNFRIR